MRAYTKHKKESKNWAKSNEMIAYLNAMTVITVEFNSGEKFNVPLTEKLDKFLLNRKK